MGKKRKFDALSSSSSSSSSNKTVKYSDLPEVQKKKWVLSGDLNVLDEYFKLLDWISDWGSKDGFEFEGIKTMGCISGYPLIEVEVIYQEKSRKFLISRASLYILAFYSATRGWSKFKDIEFDIEISGVVEQLVIEAKYEGKSWAILDLRAMVDAFIAMDSSDDNRASEACLLFAVHLSEASRIRLIRSKIAQSMIPVVSTNTMMHNDDENMLLGSEGCLDVLTSLHPIVVDMDFCVYGDDYMEGFIKKFKQLTKAWMVYALTKKKICPLAKNIVDKCGIKYVKTLRYALLLLSNTSLDKIVKEWVEKFNKGQCPPNIKEADIRFME